MFRTVLVHLDNTKGSTARLRFAASLAREFDAMLVGITAALPHMPVEIYESAMGTAVVDPDYIDYDRRRLEGEFAKTADAFKRETEKAGLETAWRASFEPTSDAIVRAAVAADIVVVGRGDGAPIANMQTAAPGEIVLRTGRPVLIAPEGQEACRPTSIVVAWKDSSESQRAIADAIPFMKRASQVTVVAVREHKDDNTPGLDDALGFLLRHGIAAKSRVVDGKNGAGPDLLELARTVKADLVVAGAYGHSRWREWAFGGVTRELLLRAPVPCLFSH
jgi:nucleotide-binding universal stress UspA family protein